MVGLVEREERTGKGGVTVREGGRGKGRGQRKESVEAEGEGGTGVGREAA